MSDRLERGMSRMAERIKAKAPRSVIYTRGSDSVTLAVKTGSTLLRLTDEYGAVTVQRTDRDFLFTAADLILGGELTTPERGDVITEDDGIKVYTFKLLPYANEPCWRWADDYRIMIRVHVKLTSEEDS